MHTTKFYNNELWRKWRHVLELRALMQMVPSHLNPMPSHFFNIFSFIEHSILHIFVFPMSTIKVHPKFGTLSFVCHQNVNHNQLSLGVFHLFNIKVHPKRKLALFGIKVYPNFTPYCLSLFAIKVHPNFKPSCLSFVWH